MSRSEYKKHSDPELIDLCLQGDALAWETLIMRYRRLMYSVPIKFYFSDADASDIFQAACVKLLEHLHEVRDDRKIGLWLMKTIVRMCIQLKALQDREGGTEDEGEEPLDPAGDLEEMQIAIEKEQSIRDAVGLLPTRCRLMLEMLYFTIEPPSYDEIGQKLDMPESSVGPIRARCLERLRDIFRKRGIRP